MEAQHEHRQLLHPPTEFELSANFSKDNRTRFLKLFRERVPDSGKNSVMLFQGVQTTPVHDQDIDFYPEQECNFLYLFGVKEEDCHALIDIETEDIVLFVKKHEDFVKYWRKLQTPEYFMKKYGFSQVLYDLELKEFLTKKAPEKLFLYHGIDIYSDLPSRTPSFEWLSEFPVDKKELYPILNETRVFKSDEEIEVLRFLVKLTSMAHVATMQNSKPGLKEFQLEALHKFIHMERCGARFEAYNCIFASGCDASILHYNQNSKAMEDGSLCLNDSGGKYLGYISDITCTFPVNGKFTEKQKQIYDAVLKAQRHAYTLVKPGAFWQDIHNAAEKSILQSLLDLGLLQGGSVEELWNARVSFTFFPHGLGHFFGLRVHDVAGICEEEKHLIQPTQKQSLRVKRTLKERMAMTNEPGIYFIESLLKQAYEDEKISKYFNKEKIAEYSKEVSGVRIEDDFIVTSSGYEILCHVPRTTGQIEACMAGSLDWEKLE